MRVGGTDSEKAFCLILETLREAFPLGKPSLPELHSALLDVTRRIARSGPFNYLLSDGESFFAHCSTNLVYLVRQAPFSAAHLVDEDVTVDFQGVASERDRVAIVATAPLTDNENWTRFLPGQLIAFQDGQPLKSSIPVTRWHLNSSEFYPREIPNYTYDTNNCNE